ncbi:MAG: Smr/MutS family protein [Bacteroidales bacterium]|nr:Smr/MutS family protein [Bacteroidales bacterium]
MQKKIVIYPENFEVKTGFDKLRIMVENACISDAGVAATQRMKASFAYDTLLHKLRETEEFRQILLLGEPFPAQDYFDLTDDLTALKLPGTFPEVEMLGFFKASLLTLAGISHFFSSEEKNERFPLLSQLSKNLWVEPAILPKLEGLIDEKGIIRSNASEKLREIRKKIEGKQAGIGSRIHKILVQARQQGWIKEDTEVSIRNGRPVLPVPATHKRRIKGWIHDQSATGQTVYIEPAEVFEINNEIRELELDERREIIRILIAFADDIRPHIAEIIHAYRYLGEFDFIRAKAKVALETASTMPILRRRPVMNIRNARHPLLYLTLKKQQRKVIPLTLELSHNERILVISGPNAGGKSICLKTIGLLQYMLQCGMLIPANENSEFGIFRNILIDIGDEQSLENDLSTYTSHLQNLKVFLRNADRHTLFLIDEFGTGTEPNLGGAIAESTLETLNNLKAWGVVTTHYANLKLMSGKHEGIVNGAMLFDSKKLQPLFMLQTGKPGSSFAFEMARKIGFPEEILELAGKKTGKKQLDFDQQLHQMEIEKKDLTQKQTEVQLADELLKEILEKYKTKIKLLEEQRKKILEQAQEEAQQIIATANSRIEHTIKEIREVQAEKEKTKTLRKKLTAEAAQSQKKHHQQFIRLKEELEEITVETGEEIPVLLPKTGETFKKGDAVKIIGQKESGIITSIRGKKATIEFENMRIRAELETLEKAEPHQKGNRSVRLTTAASGNIIHDLTLKTANFRISIDIRGQRAEEALSTLEKYIDDALLLRIPEIKILHGKGNGILREAIRNFLKSMPEVQNYKDEDLERGGSGITAVRLRL